jgi:ferredoxin
MKDPIKLQNFPSEIKDKNFNIKVNIGGITKQIPAKGIETVLVALERAKLSPPSLCRSGECGFCRSRLLSGEVYINPNNDGRREADKKFNIFHPCSSYPLSNLEIEIPRTKN